VCRDGRSQDCHLAGSPSNKRTQQIPQRLPNICDVALLVIGIAGHVIQHTIVTHSLWIVFSFPGSCPLKEGKDIALKALATFSRKKVPHVYRDFSVSSRDLSSCSINIDDTENRLYLNARRGYGKQTIRYVCGCTLINLHHNLLLMHERN
jgi:hypothetical protein